MWVDGGVGDGVGVGTCENTGTCVDPVTGVDLGVDRDVDRGVDRGVDRDVDPVINTSTGTGTGTGHVRAALNAAQRLRRIVQEGALFDQDSLRQCMRANLGEATFLEAFQQTRRVLCVSVSPSTRHELPRLLNYLTAPSVVVWSAVVASCAVPGVFRSTPLLAKDPASGALVPWSLGEARWIDGSAENDIPRRALAELFNVNHTIVSQVNPHVVPFLAPRGRSLPARALAAGLFLLHSELVFRLEQLAALGCLVHVAHRLLGVLRQHYSGDITIVPRLAWQDLPLLFSNPTPASLRASMRRGERATWPALSAISNQCRVELVLEQLLEHIKARPNVHVPERGSLPRMRRPSSPLVYRGLDSSASFETLSRASSDG